MTVDIVVDWEAIKQEIERFFAIPDDLPKNGISAIRAMIFRRRYKDTEKLLDISHGKVGLFGDQLDSFVNDSFRTIKRERIFQLGTDSHPGKGLVTIETRGDLVIIEYLDIKGQEEPAEKLTGAMLMLVGNYANRNL